MIRHFVIFYLLLGFSLGTRAQVPNIRINLKKSGQQGNDPVGKAQRISGNANMANSQLRKSDYFQTTQVAAEKSGYTRHSIAGNLSVDIKGNYPKGYAPLWNYVSQWAPLTFHVDNYIAARSLSPTESRNIVIGEYKGKAVLGFNALTSCDCIADIAINDIALLTNIPQTFKVTNFRKLQNGIVTESNCTGNTNNIYTAGGFEGKITLSANENGDIEMSLLIENYRLADRFSPAGVSYRYAAQQVNIVNKNTVAHALNTVKQKWEQAIADSLARIEQERRRAENERNFELNIQHSLSKVAKAQNAYPGNYACLKEDREEKVDYGIEYETITEKFGTVDAAGNGRVDFDTYQRPVRYAYTVKSEGLRNTCNQATVIKGIRKLKSNRGTIYYEDASIRLAAGEITDGILKIEPAYNPEMAQVGSVHYYKNNIIVK